MHSLTKFKSEKFARADCVYEMCDLAEAQQITGMSASALRNAFWTRKVAGRITQTGRIYLSIPSLLNAYKSVRKVSDVLGS